MNPALDSELARAALEVYERELGGAAAFADTVLPPADPANHDRAVFAAAMVELARQVPQRFGPLLATFGERPEPGALAAVYAQRSMPETLGRFRGNADENDEIARSRACLTHWTGCELFATPPQVVVVRPSCTLFLAYMRCNRVAAGMVLFEHEALRSTVWLAQRSLRRYRRRDWQANLADLIVHEQLHCVIAQLGRGEDGIYGQPLVEAVEEGCVELLSFLASSGQPNWLVEQPRFASWCEDSPYAQQRHAVMEVLGGRPSARLARSAFALALANVRGASDGATARELNRLSGRRLSAERWLELVGSLGCVPQPEALHAF